MTYHTHYFRLLAASVVADYRTDISHDTGDVKLIHNAYLAASRGQSKMPSYYHFARFILIALTALLSQQKSPLSLLAGASSSRNLYNDFDSAAHMPPAFQSRVMFDYVPRIDTNFLFDVIIEGDILHNGLLSFDDVSGLNISPTWLMARHRWGKRLSFICRFGAAVFV